MAQPTARNHAQKGNHKHYDRMSLLNPQRHVVPAAVLTQSKTIPINVVRPVSTVVPKISVTIPRQATTIVTKSKSPPRRHINRSPSPKASNPQHALKDKGVIDSGCSRHMTGNMSYLSGFKEINGGYIAFVGNPKGGKISRKGKIRTGKLDFDDVYFVKKLKFNLFSVSQMCDKKNSVLFTDTECLVFSPDFKLPDESQVLLRVPRENNMYNVNLKNIIHSVDLTCLFAKATLDESNLWHRRLGHINFKTMNKLVKGNLVRGLPTKVFETDNTCVACKKGKQHRASCKFVGKVDEGFLVGYSVSSKAFRVFNSRTRIVQKTLHVNFLENKPNFAGSGPTWLSDIDTLTKTMNYQPVTAGNQSNPSAGVQDKFDVEKPGEENAAFDEKEPEFNENKPEFEVNVSLSSSTQSKKHDDKTKREAKGKSPVDTNTFSAAGLSNVVASPTHGKSSCIDTSQLLDDPDMLELEDITYSNDEDDVGTEADFNNLETSITVSPIPITRVHKDHYVTQIIGDLSSATQTRKEPKRVHQALKDPSWIKAMQVELLQFKMQKVWVLVDLPYEKRAIGTKWVFKNKKDERGIVSAFMYGTIKEKVYVYQPLGFEDPDYPDKVYKVVKALYGLHQAPRA
nr:ribonuclease H-like domain-containing protein [Tanacetum cinerariifolium]